MLHGAICSSVEKYAFLISQCITTRNLKLGEALHSHLIKSAFFFDYFLANRLIDMYIKCSCVESAQRAFEDLSHKTTRTWNMMISFYAKMGLFDRAHSLFDKMPEPNLISYNSLITGLTHNAFHKESVKLFWKMQTDYDCLLLDEFTLVSIVGSCASLASLYWLRQVHGIAVIIGLEGNVVLNNALIDAYGKCDLPNISSSIFYRMPERDVVSWTSMIAAYTRATRLEEACRIFNEMPMKNNVSWTALITGFARNGRFEEALDLFGQMLEEGVWPSAPTNVTALSACADMALIERGKQIHGHIIKNSNNGYLSDLYISNALIDMYSKCGDMKSAENLFKTAPSPLRDIISWNTLITGFAQNGHGEESLALFKRMIEANVKPNHVTFLGLLSACDHAGLDNEGLELKDMMEKQYGLKPRLDHYAILIDLLGRKNRFEEALDLIERTPDAMDHVAIWGALLAACRVHGNLDLASRSAEALFKHEPENTARYVMLSNIYAALGRWNDANRIKKIMEEKGLKKEAGCSWIELRNTRHEFRAKDKCHGQIVEICGIISNLVHNMKDVGYQYHNNCHSLPGD